MAQKGAIQVNDASALYQQVNQWLNADKGKLSRDAYAKQAALFIKNKQGATQRLLALITCN